MTLRDRLDMTRRAAETWRPPIFTPPTTRQAVASGAQPFRGGDHCLGYTVLAARSAPPAV